MGQQLPQQGPQGPQGERRQDFRLRAVFDSAYSLVEPFFDPEAGWAGHSLEHLAFRVIRENFPDLSSGDVHVLVVAAHRIYIERHPSASHHLRRPTEIPVPR